MKKFVCLALILLMAMFSAVPAYADNGAAVKAPGPQDVAPARFTHISLLNAGLDISPSGLAGCLGNVFLYNSSYTAVLTVELQKYTSSGWSTIKTWTTSSTGYANIEGNYYVVYGTYRVRTTAQVYNPSGDLLETESLYSRTVIY